MTHLNKEHYNLSKYTINGVFKVLGTKIVNRIVVRSLHVGKPHVMDVFKVLFFDFAARKNVVQIGIKNKFEHHSRMIG